MPCSKPIDLGRLAALLGLFFPLWATASVCTDAPLDPIEQQVSDAYLAYYGRPADVGGLGYWSERLAAAGGDLADIIQAFGESEEFANRFGGLDAAALIVNLYRQLFGRDPDTDGLAFYLDELENGRLTLQSIALDLLNGAQALDAAIVAARREVAAYCIACLEQGHLSYPPIELAVGLLGTVDADLNSVEAAMDAIDEWIDTPLNQAPIAAPLSLFASPSVTLVEVKLTAFDPDNDVIWYHLVSDPVGGGYLDAWIGSETGRLYLTLDGRGENVRIQYQATDGLIYSNVAEVFVEIRAGGEGKGRGAEETHPEDYAGFTVLTPWGNLLGAPGESPTIPRRIDLSASFPRPGDQGQQGSCVGWATAYALKSYLEKIDQGWDLDRQDHLFSPAYLFNAIALPNCDGTYFSWALDRLQRVGAATWSQMPYRDWECTSIPSAQADAQAASFRIRSWGTLRTLEDVKAQLANRRPVLAGIMVYPALERLGGTNPVYSDYSGASLGGHAVTLVGYDDDRYGGAFKVMNSWGTGFGDGGFFWLPYSALADPDVVRELYSVEDISLDYDPDVPVDPPPLPEQLPNLEILSWSATYDPRPGGAGFLEYEVANTGTALAASQAFVNLMLSADETIGNDDHFVVYEPIPFELLPGESAYRDAFNRLRFNFPDNVPTGTYYMALWVDDLDTIHELNEQDNISFGDQVRIETSQSDLAIISWSADWVGPDGTLTYTVANQGIGSAPPGWDVNLMLSDDQQVGNADDTYLVWETASKALAAGEVLRRDAANPLHFDVGWIMPGEYYLALWVDDLELVAESNERNNVSWGPGTVSFDNPFPPIFSAEPATAATARASEVVAAGTPQRQYNGRRPPSQAILFPVRITEGADGKRHLERLAVAGAGEASKPIHDLEALPLSKTNRARLPRVFPIGKARPMPLDE